MANAVRWDVGRSFKRSTYWRALLLIVKYRRKTYLCIYKRQTQRLRLETNLIKSKVHLNLFLFMIWSNKNLQRRRKIDLNLWWKEILIHFSKMFAIGLLFVFALPIHSQFVVDCDFDYGQKCLEGLPSVSFVLLNETSEQPRQPASDVTTIGKQYFLSLSLSLSSSFILFPKQIISLHLGTSNGEATCFFSISNQFIWNVFRWKNRCRSSCNMSHLQFDRPKNQL